MDMAATFAMLDAQGVPVVISSNQGGGMVAVPEWVDPATHMCLSGDWVSRPRVMVAVSADTLEITGAPPGTTLEVVDIEVGAVLANASIVGTETLHLPDAGTYQIDLRAPSPFIGWSGVVQC